VVLQKEEEVRSFVDQLIKGERGREVVWERHDVANVQHSNAMLVDILFDARTYDACALFDLRKKVLLG
jgi:hypothetical protein